MPKPQVRISVTFGEGVAVIRNAGSSRSAAVAVILGTEYKDGQERIYLDRLVHGRFQDWGEWSASGAVSTVLSRPVAERDCLKIIAS